MNVFEQYTLVISCVILTLFVPNPATAQHKLQGWGKYKLGMTKLEVAQMSSPGLLENPDGSLTADISSDGHGNSLVWLRFSDALGTPSLRRKLVEMDVSFNVRATCSQTLEQLQLNMKTKALSIIKMYSPNPSISKLSAVFENAKDYIQGATTPDGGCHVDNVISLGLLSDDQLMLGVFHPVPDTTKAHPFSAVPNRTYVVGQGLVDCATASTRVEKAVCGSEDLRTKDQVLAHAFSDISDMARDQGDSGTSAIYGDKNVFVHERDSCSNGNPRDVDLMNCIDSDYVNTVNSLIRDHQLNLPRLEIKAKPDPTPPLSADDLVAAFSVYLIAKECADHSIAFSSVEVDAIRASIKARADKGGISQDDRDKVWTTVRAARQEHGALKENDCIDSRKFADGMFPDALEPKSLEKSPF